jgi:branched-chain amino acid transport system substrate-binding protein
LNRRALATAAAGCVSAAIAIAGCGGSLTTTSRTATVRLPKFVDVYSSLPESGPEAVEGRAIEAGIQLALAQARDRAGSFSIVYRHRNDATDEGWSPALTARNARGAASDPNAVYYIGEFDSGASEISMPILNQAGIAQLSPANTYVGLTERIATVTRTGEPGGFRPAGRITYMRIVPNDKVQAAADLEELSAEHCTRIAIAFNRLANGQEIAGLAALSSPAYSVAVVSRKRLASVRGDLHGYLVDSVEKPRADCLLLAGAISAGTIAATDFVQSHLAPPAKVVGSDGMCTDAWASDPDSAMLSRFLECTLPVLGIHRYQGASQFLDAYQRMYGHTTPSPYAILGYEAMELGLGTIARLGAAGDNRALILRALLATHQRESEIGTYSLEPDGDTTQRAYGLYRVTDGVPSFVRTLTPPTVLP